MAEIVIENLPELLNLTRGSFDAMIKLSRPLAGDLQFFLRITDGVTGFLHGGLLHVGGIAQTGELRAEKFLLTLLQRAGAETDLILPVGGTFVFQPDSIARDVVADFIEDAAGFVAIDDELGAEILDGFQRRDFGAVGHGLMRAGDNHE